MFDKILIANRGEIACRVIRTCKKMNIRTVAVYSETDTRNLHVQMADEAFCIGPSPARESYLAADKIISIALSSGCRAIHPGYGFLSENQRFAEAAAAAGLTFIGPPPTAISMMGDKIASKELAKKTGVPVIPGHDAPLESIEEALAAASRIGYPVLLKPAAGGGGKGMRIVFSKPEMEAALSTSRAETRKAFGDTRIFMERYIERPRHIEIQILTDAFGNIIHLGERECSIQRRHQKVIEESPSPAVSAALRDQMGLAACNLAKAAGYVNAGTVEFVTDEQGNFYFLEMNTRLQVEHPVTELVTGLDLVELQLRIADGERLPFTQKDVRLSGWAIEARICAENPAREFLPSTGMITRYAEPRGEGVRVDSGVQTGSLVSVYYDSMLAKVICAGRDREEARGRLVEALNGYHIEGVTTNVDFVNAVLAHPEFINAHLSTDFIDAHFQGARPRTGLNPEHLRMAALAATLVHHVRTVAVRDSLKPMTSRIGREAVPKIDHHYKVRSDDDVFDIRLNGSMTSRKWITHVDGERYDVETPEFEFYRRRLKLTINGVVHRFRMQSAHPFLIGSFCGICRLFEIYIPREWEMIRHMPKDSGQVMENVLACPMPGLVVAIRVQKGDRVFRGQDLVVIESMKMESGVASKSDGRVVDIMVKESQSVDAGDILIRFEPIV
ncbi:MAG: acetyl-CoA carboxylase biotin carboxylase subunit [Desulfosalsimonadaceae bacterium]